MKLRVLVFITSMVALVAGAAHAQLNNEVFPVWFKLEDADVKAIREAEDRILANQSIKPGLSEPWKGAGTGNAGRVSVLKLFKKKGGDCIQAAYDFKFARAADQVRYTLPWCKFPDGSWKLVF